MYKYIALSYWKHLFRWLMTPRKVRKQIKVLLADPSFSASVKQSINDLACGDFEILEADSKAGPQ